jgi:glutamate dehydrogenase
VHFGIDRLLTRVSLLPREEQWDALARGALRDDLYAVLNVLTAAVMAQTDKSLGPDQRLAAWDEAHTAYTERTRDALARIEEMDDASLAPLSVALRALRAAVR